MSQGCVEKRKTNQNCIKAGLVRLGESLQTPELAEACWLFEPFPLKTVGIPFLPNFFFLLYLVLQH